VIVETNVNDIINPKLFYSREGMEGELINVHELKECLAEEKESGCYHEISDASAGTGWHQKRYEIQPENFEKEGIYNVLIYSKDAAGNESNNTSSRHMDGKLNVQFAVNRTVTDLDGKELLKKYVTDFPADVKAYNLPAAYASYLEEIEETGNYEAINLGYDGNITIIATP